jgi:hypothetical protein
MFNKDYLIFEEEFYNMKTNFMTQLEKSLLACMTITPEMDAFDAVFNVSQWPSNFATVDADYFKKHASAMCAHWCKDNSLLPTFVILALEDELLKLKILVTETSTIIDSVKVNGGKRRLFWPLFLERYGDQLPTLGFFWKLQQQLGRSGVAIEQFISKLHYIVGDPLRQHSSDSWLEYSTIANVNGPPVEEFKTSEVLPVWLKMKHELVKVGRVAPVVEKKEQNVYGPAKRAQRNIKKVEKRKKEKLDVDVARGNIVPVELDSKTEQVGF